MNTIIIYTNDNKNFLTKTRHKQYKALINCYFKGSFFVTITTFIFSNLKNLTIMLDSLDTHLSKINYAG